MPQSRTIIQGSDRLPIQDSQPLSSSEAVSNPDELLTITVLTRRRASVPANLSQASVLSHEELTTRHGAAPDDMTVLQRFAQEHNFQIIDQSLLMRTMQLTGTVHDMEQAFGTTLRLVRVGDTVYRERTGPLTLPADVAEVINDPDPNASGGVFGLDNRPAAQAHFRLATGPVAGPRTAQAFSPLDVARLYNFPPGTGANQTIALVELGGGFVPDDLNTYFSSLGVASPTVTAVSVLGSANLPTHDPNGPDGEVMLDIEVAGAIAPQAHIKVYFAPNTDQGFLAAVNAAVHDTPAPAAVSISWGGPEASFTVQSRNAFEQVFQDAALLNVVVTAASGDSGSTDGTSALSVDFPASAPHALGCGGTHLEGTAAITLETVWNSNGGSTGGGISAAFPKPDYQRKAKVPKPTTSGGGRGVPDVSGNAAPETGYRVRVDGQEIVVGGTSAVAPLWAGLIARLAESLGHGVSFLNPVLYMNPHLLHDITQGTNDVGGGSGHYRARRGWDPCTGLGSPDGAALLQVLSSLASLPPSSQ